MLGSAHGPARETFHAMGSRCEIHLSGTHGHRSTAELLHVGRTLTLDLEQKWSRFLPNSDVTAINAHAGQWVEVDRHSRNAMTLAEAGRSYTDGRYNPLVGADLVRLGYSATFDAISLTSESGDAGREHDITSAKRHAVSGPIEVDEPSGCVRIPAGTMLDLGGIGKGYAADLLVDSLLALGATGVMVNLGGDVRVVGENPGQPYWSIQVGDRNEVVLLEDGAVAFSSTAKRRWFRDDRWLNHLVDPASGSSVQMDLPIVCVVSASGWWSEVLTKSIAVHISRALTAPGVRPGMTPDLSSVLGQAVPSGVHALVSADGETATTDQWASVSARLELAGSR